MASLRTHLRATLATIGILLLSGEAPGNEGLAVWYRSPWAEVLPQDAPDPQESDLTALHIVAGQNEYESQVFLITNFGSRSQSLQVELRGPLSRPEQWGGQIKLRHTVFVTGTEDRQDHGLPHEDESSQTGHLLADALPLLDHPLVIPAQQSQQIWLQVYTAEAVAGTYPGEIVLTVDKGEQRRLALSLEVLPVRIPDELPLATYSWQYIDGKKGHSRNLKGLEKEAVADLAAHYTNVNILGSHARWSDLSKENGDIDDQGNIIKQTDWSEFDRWIELGKPISQKGITWFPSMKVFQEMRKETTPYRTYSQWTSRWVAHLKEMGLGYDDFFAYPVDEDIASGLFFNSVKAIRSVDPKIRIFAIYVPDMIMRGTDGPLGDLIAAGMEPDWSEVVKAAAPYVDVWCIPRFSGYPLQREFLLNTGKPVWSYFISMRYKPPYQVYRLHCWDAFTRG